MLKVFWGGFLYNSCFPLELSLNWCSANCHYCFANLNNPKRKADLKQILGLLTDYKNRQSYAAWLLQQGYPITFSNHVDPFATSNDRYSLKILELMELQGIRYSLQTKGGRRVDEALDIISQPIVFYVSLATLNEDVRRSAEPGAPPIKERLAMLERIIAKGHQVCVGINPAVPSWLPDPKPLTDILKSLGVWGIWTQPMHLSHAQVQKMSEQGREALGEGVLHQAMYPVQHPEVHQHYLNVRLAAQESGLEVYDNQQKEYSNYFQPYKTLYPKTFPLYQEFVNHCHQTKRDGDVIYWREFRDFFLPQLPDCGERGLRDHINATTLSEVLYGKYIPQRMTYEGLLKWIWTIKEILFCPANIECFGWAADWEIQADGKPGWTRYVDTDNLPILVFKPEGTNGQAYVPLN